LPQTPLESLQRSPDPIANFIGGLLLKGEEGRRREKSEERGGKAMTEREGVFAL